MVLSLLVGLALTLPVNAANWRLFAVSPSGQHASYAVLAANFAPGAKGSPVGFVTLKLAYSAAAAAAFKAGTTFKSVLLERLAPVAGKPQVVASTTFDSPKVARCAIGAVAGRKVLVVKIRPGAILPS